MGSWRFLAEIRTLRNSKRQQTLNSLPHATYHVLGSISEYFHQVCKRYRINHISSWRSYCILYPKSYLAYHALTHRMELNSDWTEEPHILSDFATHWYDLELLTTIFHALRHIYSMKVPGLRVQLSGPRKAFIICWICGSSWWDNVFRSWWNPSNLFTRNAFFPQTWLKEQANWLVLKAPKTDQ